MNHYIYKCFDCQTDFSVDEIESNLHYLCPHCGRAEKNRPLQGVLWVQYDYLTLKKQLNKDKFLNLPEGQFRHYPELLPLNYRMDAGKAIYKNITSEQLQRLFLNGDPFFEYEFQGNPLYFFDDTRNPTLSFKDRASSLVALKALQLGIREIAVASTGNAASSLAGISARLRLNAHVLVPASIPDEKRIQIQAYGASIYLVESNYDQAFDLCVGIAQEKGWYNRNTAYNPLTIEGKKSAAFDIFIATRGNLPNYLFIPVGDGVVISGLYKGFWELQQLGWIQKLPKLIAVQAKGSDALVRYLQTGHFEFQSAHTIADSICAGVPRNLYMATHAVKESRGEALAVSDEEILNAQKILAKQVGVLVEPAAAASLAGYQKFKERIPKDQKVLLILTGNGLKDIAALKQWNQKLVSHTLEKWREIFQI